MDFSAVGTSIGNAFTAIGNAMLIAGGGIVFCMLALAGLTLLFGPINRRVVDFAKSNIGYIIGGAAILGSAGLVGRVLGAAIAAGKM